ncbi:hypothetical protein AQJ84_01710 [Streptomyces resistomycificus]|uniref:Uncharacterized protein n=1 Tax=Streptomyces resistomycificus TaxID=67356 RepID=A0A0L8L2Y1_9ACTN|nr:hypothetical protein ADK37_26760 [Streptomyces resistomycificus]KUO01196.1 hypothetical protein AQJ84_01710 [Streptomyces resistomycificus]
MVAAGEGVVAAPTAAVFVAPAPSAFDEQPVIRAAVATSPPVRTALRCGMPTLPMICCFLPVE